MRSVNILHLIEGNNQIFASKYFTYLPTEEELKRKLRID